MVGPQRISVLLNEPRGGVDEVGCGGRQREAAGELSAAVAEGKELRLHQVVAAERGQAQRGSVKRAADANLPADGKYVDELPRGIVQPRISKLDALAAKMHGERPRSAEDFSGRLGVQDVDVPRAAVDDAEQRERRATDDDRVERAISQASKATSVGRGSTRGIPRGIRLSDTAAAGQTCCRGRSSAPCGTRANLCDPRCVGELGGLARGRAIARGIDDGVGWLADVGHYPRGASPQRLLDMHGNVVEIVGDGDGFQLRGGSWLGTPAQLRASSQSGIDIDDSGNGIGFRCAQ